MTHGHRLSEDLHRTLVYMYRTCPIPDIVKYTGCKKCTIQQILLQHRTRSQAVYPHFRNTWERPGRRQILTQIDIQVCFSSYTLSPLPGPVVLISIVPSRPSSTYSQHISWWITRKTWITSWGCSQHLYYLEGIKMNRIHNEKSTFPVYWTQKQLLIMQVLVADMGCTRAKWNQASNILLQLWTSIHSWTDCVCIWEFVWLMNINSVPCMVITRSVSDEEIFFCSRKAVSITLLIHYMPDNQVI